MGVWGRSGRHYKVSAVSSGSGWIGVQGCCVSVVNSGTEKIELEDFCVGEVSEGVE